MRMRGVVALLVLAGIVILLSSGLALANKPIDCSGGPCQGTAKNDTMHGTAAPDEINARRGDDGMYGLGSDDFLYGQRGADTLQAGGEDDALYGDFGNDKLRGGLGADVLRGDDDFEQNKNAIGRDRLSGGNGADELYGYYGDDKLVGEKATTSSTRMTNRPPNGRTTSTAAQDGTRSISTRGSTNSGGIVR